PMRRLLSRGHTSPGITCGGVFAAPSGRLPRLGRANHDAPLGKALAAQLIKLREPIYDLRRRQVKTLVAEPRLATGATRRGIAMPPLLDAEVTARRGLVTEQEVDAFYRLTRPGSRATKPASANRLGPTSRTRSWCGRGERCSITVTCI